MQPPDVVLSSADAPRAVEGFQDSDVYEEDLSDWDRGYVQRRRLWASRVSSSARE